MSAELGLSLSENISLNSRRIFFISSCNSFVPSITILARKSASESSSVSASGFLNGPNVSFISQSISSETMRSTSDSCSFCLRIVATVPHVLDGVSMRTDGEATSVMSLRGIS